VSQHLLICLYSTSLYSQVVTDILHLHGKKLTAYKGDYDTFERTREEQVKNQQKAFEANERSRAHMQVFIPLLSMCVFVFVWFVCLDISVCSFDDVDID
jgi:hypothetical protein